MFRPNGGSWHSSESSFTNLTLSFKHFKCSIPTVHQLVSFDSFCYRKKQNRCHRIVCNNTIFISFSPRGRNDFTTRWDAQSEKVHLLKWCEGQNAISSYEWCWNMNKTYQFGNNQKASVRVIKKLGSRISWAKSSEQWHVLPTSTPKWLYIQFIV